MTPPPDSTINVVMKCDVNQVALLAEVERELQAPHPQREEADAPVIDRARVLLQVRRIEDVELCHHERRDPDRQVDVENAARALYVSVSHPPSTGPRIGATTMPRPPEAHGLAALVRLELFEEHGL